MEFNKYNVLHLARHSPGMQQGWNIYLAGEKLCGKGPRVSGEHKLHMSEQGGAAAKKDNRILGCIKECFSSRDKEIITPLCSVLSSAHLEINFCPLYTTTKKCEEAGKGPEKSQNDYPRTEMSAM